MKKILITGSNGFIGSKLQTYFLAIGKYEVLPTSRSNNTVINNFIQMDLSDNNQVNKSFPKNIDTIIHCAGQTGLSMNEEIFIKNNFIATKNLVDRSIKENVKEFIFISSPSIYLSKEDQLSIKEEDIPKHIITSYAKSKKMCEEYLEEKKGFFDKIIILRPATVYGPGATALGKIIIKNQNTKKLIRFSKEHTFISMTYIDHLLDVISIFVEKGSKSKLSIYNFSDEEPLSLAKEFLEEYYKTNHISYRDISLPFASGYHLASLLKFIYQSFKINSPPPVSPYIVCNLGKNRILNTQKFHQNYDYSQKFSRAQTLDLFKSWLEKERKDSME